MKKIVKEYLIKRLVSKWVEYTFKNPLFLNKFLKGIFINLFLLGCYKNKICQKDIVENHLKTLVLAKSQN